MFPKINTGIEFASWAFADFKANQNYSRVFYNRKGVFTRERDPKMSAHTLRKIWTEK